MINTVESLLQYIIDKARGPHVTETINEYFLSLADNMANLAEISLGGSSDREFLSYMEQASKLKNYSFPEK
jgi:hypothetical protein